MGRQEGQGQSGAGGCWCDKLVVCCALRCEGEVEEDGDEERAEKSDE